MDFGEGYLVGIGFGKGGCLKIEVYEEGKTGVDSVAVYEKECDFSQDYKSYLIDREKNLVGLATYSFDGKLEYVLLHFDGYGWTELVKVPVDWTLRDIRGVLIDGWLYVFDDAFHVVQVW